VTWVCQILSRAAFPPVPHQAAGIPPRVPARRHPADPGVQAALRGRAQEEGRDVAVGRLVVQRVERQLQQLGLRQREVGRRWTAGAPWVAAARLVERGLACGLTVGVALEEPEACGNVKRRRLAYIFERPSDAEAKLGVKQEESK
jgi:hypothetical protein